MGLMSKGASGGGPDDDELGQGRFGIFSEHIAWVCLNSGRFEHLACCSLSLCRARRKGCYKSCFLRFAMVWALAGVFFSRGIILWYDFLRGRIGRGSGAWFELSGV